MAIFHNNQLGQSRPLSENRDYHSICAAASSILLQAAMPEIPSRRGQHRCRREQCAHIGEGGGTRPGMDQHQLREAVPLSPRSLSTCTTANPAVFAMWWHSGTIQGDLYFWAKDAHCFQDVESQSWWLRYRQGRANFWEAFRGYSPWASSKACASKTCQWHRAKGGEVGWGGGIWLIFFFSSLSSSLFFAKIITDGSEASLFSSPKAGPPSLPPSLLPNPPTSRQHSSALVLLPSPTLSYRTEIQEVVEFLVCFHCSHSLLLLVHAPSVLKKPYEREIHIWGKLTTRSGAEQRSGGPRP